MVVLVLNPSTQQAEAGESLSLIYVVSSRSELDNVTLSQKKPIKRVRGGRGKQQGTSMVAGSGSREVTSSVAETKLRE